jgi:hypothetical protein
MTKRGPNLLDLIPERTRPFRDEDDGTVTVLVPRFGDGRAGHLLQKFVGKSPISLHLDEIGSEVWRLCDGRRSVYEIGECLRRKFGDRIEPVFEKLGVYFRRMKRADVIEWRR